MEELKRSDFYLKLFLSISLTCITFFWIVSLVFVFYIHKKTTLKDLNNIGSFLEEGFSYTQDWEFIQDLWSLRPSLMALSIEEFSSGEEVSSVSFYRNYYKEFLPFQGTYSFDLDLILLDGSLIENKIKAVYSFLPAEEFIYYSIVSLFLLILILLLYLIFSLKLP